MTTEPTEFQTCPPSTPLPELLAPAGDFAALRAAIGNGANAVYLGAAAFSARRGAPNFNPTELTEAIDYAHLRSARVYLALNTLIGDDEGEAALELAAQAFVDGIDAIIIQDIGLAAVLHHQLPDLPLHASTQMTIHDVAGLKAAARLGIRRVILPRELSCPEIADLTSQANALGLQTEVFVHGALCVAFSGQCLLSSLSGGRSGNRGACAQPCRLSWRRSGPSGKKPEPAFPWLSPRDQALLRFLPDLATAGVSSLKIEGRMRSSTYVGQVTAVYREALDRMCRPPEPAVSGLSEHTGSGNAEQQRRLLLAFNRGGGLTDRYASGVNNADFLSGRHVGSHGLLLGQVTRVDARDGLLSVMTDAGWPNSRDPRRGDILSIRRPDEARETASAPIGKIERQGRLLLIRGFHPAVLTQIREGDPVFQMNDHTAEQEALQADLGRTALRLFCRSKEDKIILSGERLPDLFDYAPDAPDPRDQVAAEIECPAETVEPLSAERAQQQIAKTGGTPFRIDSIQIDQPLPVKISTLNSLRRQLMDELAERLVRRARRELPARYTADWLKAVAMLPAGPQRDRRPDGRIVVHYHRLPDDDQAVACGADAYVLPLMELNERQGPAAVAAIRQSEPDSLIFARLPSASAGRGARLRDQMLARLAECELDGLYAAARPENSQLHWIADTAANLFNQASLRWLAAEGAVAVCPSLELENARLRPLLNTARQLGLPLELPLYGRLRLMSSAYCPIGQNLPGCRRCQPADSTKPAVWLLHDDRNDAYPVLPNPAACTSEIFSPFLLSAASDLLRLTEDQSASAAGGHCFAMLDCQLSFLDETESERKVLTAQARQLINADNAEDRRAGAEKFQATAGVVANRLDSRVAFGHYRQGV